MSESMIERVAEAMARQVGGKPLSDNEYYTDAHREWYRKAARAAIEAMREPTEAQINAACAARIPLYPAWEGEKPQPTAGEVISVSYRAMIDAALIWPAGSADKAGVPLARD